MENTLPAQSETKELEAAKQQEARRMMEEAGVSGKDLMLSKLLLMQNTSEAVGDGKSKMGEILDSETGEVHGSVDKPMLIVPLKHSKVWRIYDASVQPGRFMRTEPVTPGNEKLPWEDTENGKPIKRVFCYDFIVLLASDVEAGEAFPKSIVFKSTSATAGRSLASHMFKKTVVGKRQYNEACTISVKREKKDSNTYAVLEFSRGREATKAELEQAAEWVEIMKTANIIVSEKGEAEGSAKKQTVVVGDESDIGF